MNKSWGKSSWRSFVALQQPDWPDPDHLKTVIRKLENLPALVFSGETRRLKSELKNVNTGSNFVLQVGNCAESFDDCNGPKIHNFLRILLQMSLVLSYNTERKVIKIGRVAGQYAKPRSSKFDQNGDASLPSYRGDNINEIDPTLKARTPNPERLLEGYFRAAATLNLIRAFTQGGYSDIHNLLDWKQHFFSHEISNLDYYNIFEAELTKSMPSISANKLTSSDIIFTSHEALLLEYEEAFARIDTTTGDYYSTSAHTLWIGNRTRQSDGAHIEFISGIGNPLGIKIGPCFDSADINDILKKTNKSNEDGKIMLINRFGVNNIEKELPKLINNIKKNKLKVIWCCDPMHGNTFSHNNIKVRSFEDVISELKIFFEICRKEDVVPGGVHLEISGEYVSECIGGINGLNLNNLTDNYTTKVDPRLNAAQALETAFILRKLLIETRK